MTTGTRGGPAAREQSPTAFDEPLRLLAEFHGRLQSQCDALLRFEGQVQSAGASEAVHAMAGGLRSQFDRLNGRLHQDEEQDLFPALLESMAGSDAVCIRQMIEARVEEHREIETRWLALRQWLEQVEAGYTGMPARGTVEAFVNLCRSHLAQEDQELLPMAERLLSDEALAQIGEGMRQRPD